MQFKAILISILLACFVSIADNEASAGDKSEKTYDYSDFERIKISGVYEITVRNGEDYAIKLSGKEQALARATIKVENNTLYLGHKKQSSFRGKKSLSAVVSLPSLHKIDVSGVVDGIVHDIDSDDFHVEVSGVGDLKMNGRCDTLYAELSGVGDLNAKALVCRAADVRVSGVGDASVYASETLKAHVSGIGDLTCYGSPKQVRKNRNFFSSIRVH